MTYCTPQDLIDRFGEDELLQLTDRDALGTLDHEVIERAIADAGAEIDSHLGGRYQLPLHPVPRILTTYAADIARYRLYDEQATDQVQRRYDDARKFLQAASKGDVTLGIDANGGQATPQSGAEMQSGGRAWGRDQGNGFL